METVQITIDELNIALSCINARVSRKEQGLRNFIKKMSKSEANQESGIYRMKRGKQQRELYISKLKQTAESLSERIAPKANL